MPKIIKQQNNHFSIIEDTWQILADDTALPEQGDIILSLARWQTEHVTLSHYTGGKIGLWLEPDADIESIAKHLSPFSLFAIHFPSFTDGRGFSSARLLRERYQFTGELRAVGDVFRDQLFFMARCGFDAFSVRADKNIEDALEGLQDFSEAYQISVERPEPLFRRRI
jgi:uncharacterized protein (DUF934 family)